MTIDPELWAEALRIESALGDFTPIWVADRIGYLASIGDAAGAERYRAVAQAVARLVAGSGVA
ncbi:DUF6961 family protein [Sphingomonas jatrophae]|uniref:Uncharacterized protein n=1 Tax=Sphingomonas jatrophae TaxID=1166337 RepID=A0A1I6JY99_9SPHN|nr:hypothetical protein [Sphingomonas jatrophae]SFR83878.1 hypothetical protein SAMN05192580_1065 [Sphingomonas jatrophae]